MAICAVIDLVTNEQINSILADPADIAQDGCKLVEIPDGYFWDGLKISPIIVSTSNGN